MNLYEHAKYELELLEKKCEDDKQALELQKLISKNILEMIDIFAKQGHTGTTASYIIGLLERLLRYKPLTPLTGEEDEWEDISDFQDGKPGWQNRRDPSIFQDGEGRSYNVEGKVFSDDNGHTWYTCKDSSIDITFPYDIPLYAEKVILDRPERVEMLEFILEIIRNNNLWKSDDIKESDITEDTYIKDIVTDLIEFSNIVSEKCNMQNLKNNINENDQIWNILNKYFAYEH